ncbi:MAG: L-threonylcarbamoyladenylate synthase [Cohaesibacter sp.]|nr:L-threonylcarbamoyladenylate synthase [Cohaesibacter sp.]
MTRSTRFWSPPRIEIDPSTGALQAPVDGFAQAVETLGDGGLVAVPTETVYGLAADACNGAAVAGIFAAKNRPSFNPLISHVPSLEVAQKHGCFNEQALALAKTFWPGPLTLVVPKRPDSPIADLVSAGLETIALRVPDAPLMRALSHALDRPLAAPSANRSGRVSPTSAAHVREELDARIDLIADLGACTVGVESSVVFCVTGQPVTLLRPGGLSSKAIERLIGSSLLRAGADDQSPASPGMLTSHYAPSCPVRLNARSVQPGEALLAFGPDLPDGADQAVAMINLSEIGDDLEAAQALFAGLRALDQKHVSRIAVAPIPDQGLGEAINDRLRRAAAGR